MIHFHHNTHFARLVWIIVGSVFVGDLLLPRHYHIVFAYLIAHFLGIFFKEKSDVILLAVITTVLTLVGVPFKPHDAPYGQMLLERAPAIISFWGAAFFVVKFIQLREEEERQAGRFQALFEHATQGMLMTNKQGLIVMANPSAEKLFGYSSGEMIGQKVEVLIPARFSHKHAYHRVTFHNNPHARPMGIGLNLQGRRKSGEEFPVEVSLSPFSIQQGDFVVAFVVDNTVRKMHEQSIIKQKQELSKLSEALQELNESLENKVIERTQELEQAQAELRNSLDKERELGELKSRFVSLASHEFRTPLTSILSSAGLAQQYADRQDYESVKKHTDRIKNAVNSLNTILTEFLSLGRLEEGKVILNLEEAYLPECIKEVQEDLKAIFKPGQYLEHSHTGPDRIVVDCNLMKYILTNLISNASKYSPENTLIRIISEVTAHKVIIKVIDRGIGIPESDQKHLFDRFFRASNAVNNTQGTGLGLYIVQRYAEMMGGKVEFESAVEVGSTFWVEIPREIKATNVS